MSCASSGHITKLKQSIFGPFDIYGFAAVCSAPYTVQIFWNLSKVNSLVILDVYGSIIRRRRYGNQQIWFFFFCECSAEPFQLRHPSKHLRCCLWTIVFGTERDKTVRNEIKTQNWFLGSDFWTHFDFVPYRFVEYR